MRSALPKTQKCFVTLRYSPCDNTPTAATVAVTASGVSLFICNNNLFFPNSPLRYTAVAILQLSLQLQWRQWKYRLRDLFSNQL
jgi:hypothetical protein